MAREPWVEKLEQGHGEAAWDLLIGKYHRLIAATVRHYGEGYDDVMDMFAHICESLRANEFARLRKYAAIPEGRVRFSTWLVAVVRNLVIDWFRQERGRKRLSKVVAELPAVEREAFQNVFVDGHSPAEAYELMRTKGHHTLRFSEFLKALAEAQRAVAAKRPGVLLNELAPSGAQLSSIAVHAEGEVASIMESPEAEILRGEIRKCPHEALETLAAEDRVLCASYCR